MKKFSALILTLIAALNLHADPISPQRAMSLASAYAAEGRPLRLHQTASFRAPGLSAPYYIFSRGEGCGYVIVAGDDCIPEIIGFTEHGDFDERHEAPQLLAMLDHYARIVETLQAKGLNTPYVSSDSGRRGVSGIAKARVNIPDLLTTHWHQSWPYNNRVPILKDGKRAATGCVATAGAQVFYFWRRDMPSTLDATTPTYDFGTAPVTAKYQLKKGTPLKWDLMRESYKSEPDEYCDAVAVLMAAVGMQTYLEYGESTGGYIWKLPFLHYNLNCKQADKNNGFDDERWSALIYSELSNGRPLVYAGYNEKEEGHALVIDGYRAAGDLFHFNYGWGGQSDGYYTVKESGNNNITYGISPTVMYDIHPVRYNVKADIQLPKAVYANASNDVYVSLTNKSSLPQKGIYLFASTSNKLPTSLSKSDALDFDTETEIGIDQTVELRMRNVIPAGTDPYFLFVTDANLHQLTSKEVFPVKPETRLFVESLRIDGSTTTEQHGGQTYTMAYNNRCGVTAMIRNEGDVSYIASLRLALSCSTDEGATWKHLGYKVGKMDVAPHATQPVSFTVTNSTSTPVNMGSLYRVSLVNPIPKTEDSFLYDEGIDSLAYFVVSAPDLSVERFENGVLTLKGHWDPTLFSSSTIAGKKAYATATAYDLTNVEGIERLEVDVPNPNALFYVADDCMATGRNVIKGGRCETLSLTPGYNFAPLADFQTDRASLSLASEPLQWLLLTPPFDVVLPDGVVARRLDGHTADGGSLTVTDVDALEAGKTYLVMTSSEERASLVATDVVVRKTVAENPDPAVVGTYLTQTAPEGALVIESSSMPRFVEAGEETLVEALRGYLLASDLTKSFYALPDLNKERIVSVLATGINKAYFLLEKYRQVTTPEAFASYLAAIHKAEHELTHIGESSLSTNAQANDYVNRLLALGDDYMRQVSDVGEMEVDFSSYINNRSFESRTTLGWTATASLNPNFSSSAVARVYANNLLQYLTVGADGDYIFNSSYVNVNGAGERDTLSVGISQKVECLPPGYYRMSVKVTSDEGRDITVFAGDSLLTVQGHPFGRHYFTDAVIDRVRVEPEGDGETGSLTIGIQPGWWYKADDFRLVYVGSIKESIPDVIHLPETPSRSQVRGIYTLQGIRIERITAPGIYIVDGRKVVIRKQ